MTKTWTRISEWGNQNLVWFDSLKTQFLPISLSIDPSFRCIFFDENRFQPHKSRNVLGININNRFSLKSLIMEILKISPKDKIPVKL